MLRPRAIRGPSRMECRQEFRVGRGRGGGSTRPSSLGPSVRGTGKRTGRLNGRALCGLRVCVGRSRACIISRAQWAPRGIVVRGSCLSKLSTPVNGATRFGSPHDRGIAVTETLPPPFVVWQNRMRREQLPAQRSGFLVRIIALSRPRGSGSR